MHINNFLSSFVAWRGDLFNLLTFRLNVVLFNCDINWYLWATLQNTPTICLVLYSLWGLDVTFLLRIATFLRENPLKQIWVLCTLVTAISLAWSEQQEADRFEDLSHSETKGILLQQKWMLQGAVPCENLPGNSWHKAPRKQECLFVLRGLSGHYFFDRCGACKAIAEGWPLPGNT